MSIKRTKKMSNNRKGTTKARLTSYNQNFVRKIHNNANVKKKINRQKFCKLKFKI